MNPLSQRLPASISVGGEVYPVNTHWRSCMKIILAFESGELTEGEKLEVMMELLYKKKPPLCGEAAEKAVRFLNCGENGSEGGEGAEGGRLYSFERDARFIYPAFRQSHGIDLGTARLHWWEFCWLFMDLREDCAFCRLVGLRRRRQSGSLTREERGQIAGMEGLLELPHRYSAEEQARLEDFMRGMGGVNTEIK